MKIREIVVEGKLAPEFAVIYIIRQDGEVIYIGKSFRIEDRIFEHFMDYNMSPGASNFMEYAKNNAPDSLDWDVEFIEYPKEMKYPERWARDKEFELIGIHKPKFNVYGR